MKVTNIKCPYCGASVPFDGHSRMAVCRYCDSQVMVDMDSEEQERAEKQERRRQEEERIRAESRVRQEKIDLEKERIRLENARDALRLEQERRNAQKRRDDLVRDVERQKIRIRKRRKWLILLTLICAPWALAFLFSGSFVIGVLIGALPWWRWKSYKNRLAAQDARLK